MAFHERTMQGAAAHREQEASPWAMGFLIMASIFLIVAGAFHLIQGLAAVIDDAFFAVTNNYAFDLDVTTWGWIHVVAGVLLILTGFSLFSGTTWARIVALFLTVASAIINFFYIPYFPVWAIVTLVANACVIWALTAHGSDLADTFGDT